MHIIITEKAKHLINEYVRQATGEIQGLGRVSYCPETETWHVLDARIIEQTATAGNADFNVEKIPAFIGELLTEKENLEEWKLWWHSHADMGVFWSGTDTDTMDSNPLSCKYMLSMVFNKKGDVRARVDLYEPFKVFVDEIPVSYTEETPQEIIEYVQSEIAAKVSTPPVVATNYAPLGYLYSKDDYDVPAVKKYNHPSLFENDVQEALDYEIPFMNTKDINDEIDRLSNIGKFYEANVLRVASQRIKYLAHEETTCAKPAKKQEKKKLKKLKKLKKK